MTQLKDILEPGETVLHRGSALRSVLRLLAWPMAIMAFVSAGMLLGLMEDGIANPLLDVPFAVLIAIVPVAVVAIVMGPLLGLGDASTITDRRILATRGIFRPAVTEIALSAIEDMAFQGNVLKVDGDGRILDLPAARHGLTADLLARILPRWFPDAGTPVARLGRILQQGETVIFRYPLPWINWPLQALGAGMCIFFLWLAYGDLSLGDWSGVMLNLGWSVMMTGIATSPVAGRHGWSSVVTDRRLLQHFDWDHSRYEEIPLAEIEAEWRSQFAEKLAARHRDRDLDIPARGKAAERVLAAIKRAKGTA